MKFLILSLCVAFAAAASSDEKVAAVLRSDYEQSPEGNYQFAFETDNGISSQASGSLKAVGKDEVALEVKGIDSYTSPEGKTISVSYIADENGYRPTGDHLPTPPPAEAIPEYILRSLQFIKEHPYKEVK